MTGLPRKTIFIDRNSGGRSLRQLVTDADIHVVLHDEYFTDPTTPDHVWLREIGKLRWAMVTGDIAIEKQGIFLEHLIHTRAQVFILCGLNHASPADRAGCIIAAYPAILQLCHEHSGPNLWKLKEGDKMRPVDFRHNLGKLKRQGWSP